jgi:hypothetical protein
MADLERITKMLTWGSMKPQRPTRTDIELLNLLRRRPWESRRRLTLVRAAANAILGSAVVWGVLWWVMTR